MNSLSLRGFSREKWNPVRTWGRLNLIITSNSIGKAHNRIDTARLLSVGVTASSSPFYYAQSQGASAFWENKDS